MRIAYFLFWQGGKDSGVFKKVIAQVDQWMQEGHFVRLFVLTSSKSQLANDYEEGYRHPSISGSFYTFSGLSGRLTTTYEVTRAIRKWDPSVCYMRKAAYHPALTQLARHIPTVLEINSDDVMEKKNSTLVRRVANQTTRHSILQAAVGFVCVTQELSESPHFRHYDKPTLVLGNGIDQSKIAGLPPTNNRIPRFVFLGSPGQPWHGLDKVAALARRLSQSRFDIIGSDPQSKHSALYAPNVVFHGFLSQEQYLGIVAVADVAIGSLALYRAGLQEATPLKVREYLSYGLPTIIGYSDTDFPNGAPFLLELPNSEYDMDSYVDQISEFSLRWMGRRLSKESVSHLHTGSKERIRLEFFQQFSRS